MQPEHDRARYKHKLAVLFVLQALGTTSSVALATVNGLAGLAIAKDSSLATLPVTSFVVGGAISTFFASLLMGRFGRRAGFQVGVLSGTIGALVCAYAAHAKLFWLLCAGSVLVGVYNAFGQYYRFAAAEVAPKELASRAISWVLAGGVVGAVAGPETAKFAKDLTGVEFVGAYLALSVLGLVAGALTLLFSPPRTARGRLAHSRATHAKTRVRELVSRPELRLAMASAVIGYAVMVFLMTATPLAMTHHHHPFDDTAFVIEWHVLGMFAPSFVTGWLIKRVGVLNIIMAGTLMMSGCALINLSGLSLAHFWTALVLLGVGWNFMFVAGTTLLAQASSPEESTFAQGTNEVLVFAANAGASLCAGLLLDSVGWQAMNVWVLPFLTVVAFLSLQSARRTRLRTP